MTSFYGEYRKKDIISDEEDNRISRANVDKWIFRLFLVLIGFMPMIVMASVENVISPLISSKQILTSGAKGDLFTSYKSLIILVLTIIIVFLFLMKIFLMNGRIRKTNLNYFLGLFVVGIILSTLLSPNITTAINGLYNRSDGAVTWLCYIALFFIAINIEYPKKAIEYILYSLYPFILINFLLIMLNFIGKDALNYEVVSSLISLFLPEGANISEGSVILGTLNHYNYMSGTFAIISAMYLTWAFIDKIKIRGFANFAISLVAMATMLMAASASGFVTIVCMTPFIVWIAIKTINKKVSFIYFICFYLITAAMIHILSLKNPEVWDESVGFFAYQGLYSQEQSIQSTNTNNNSSLVSLLSPTVYANDKVFELPQLPESAWSAGTGRIYIWIETLKLVMERPILGYGLDTLMYYFPHDNLEARGNLTTVTVVDKPHSLYVGIIYGTGILGFIGFILFAILTAWFAVKSIINYNKTKGLYVTLCIAWIAFLIQSFINDSLPATTCIMFILAGVMISYIFNQKENKTHQ